MSLDAVFFDVGNTLIRPDPPVGQVCAQVLLAAGHDHSLADIDALLPLVDDYYEDRYREDDTFWTSDEGATSVWVGMYSLLCRRLDIPESEAPVLARAVYDTFGSAERWSAYPDVIPAFRRLRASGIKIGILSNWDTRLEGILEGLGVKGHVDTIVCSAVEGLRKPDPRIFELACARLGTTPERSAHVGDHVYADVVGARAAGLRPVLIDRHDDAAAPVQHGVNCITTLDRLEEALR